jgi:hypothetical protein
MVKELIKVVVTVFITTLAIYPVSSIVADIMTSTWEATLMNIIIITLVRYMGFFMGVGLLMYLYRGNNTQQYSYNAQNPYTGG